MSLELSTTTGVVASAIIDQQLSGIKLSTDDSYDVGKRNVTVSVRVFIVLQCC